MRLLTLISMLFLTQSAMADGSSGLICEIHYLSHNLQTDRIKEVDSIAGKPAFSDGKIAIRAEAQTFTEHYPEGSIQYQLKTSAKQSSIQITTQNALGTHAFSAWDFDTEEGISFTENLLGTVSTLKDEIKTNFLAVSVFCSPEI